MLKIKQPKLDDTGIFVCRGINGFGKTEVNIQLIVNGKRNFSKLKKIIIIQLGISISSVTSFSPELLTF